MLLLEELPEILCNLVRKILELLQVLIKFLLIVGLLGDLLLLSAEVAHEGISATGS